MIQKMKPKVGSKKYEVINDQYKPARFKLLLDRDTIGVRLFGAPYNIHVDHPWSSCRRDYGGTPARIYLNLGHLGQVIIGLPSRVEMLGERVPWHFVRAQRWSLQDGYRSEDQKWNVIVYHPAKWLMCHHKINNDAAICGAFRWHRCSYDPSLTTTKENDVGF